MLTPDPKPLFINPRNPEIMILAVALKNELEMLESTLKHIADNRYGKRTEHYIDLAKVALAQLDSLRLTMLDLAGVAEVRVIDIEALDAKVPKARAKPKRGLRAV